MRLTCTFEVTLSQLIVLSAVPLAASGGLNKHTATPRREKLHLYIKIAGGEERNNVEVKLKLGRN